MRSSDALAIVEESRGSTPCRRQALAGIEREFARDAKNPKREPGQSAPHVDVFNHDPLSGLEIQTDLLVTLAQDRSPQTTSSLRSVAMPARWVFASGRQGLE